MNSGETSDVVATNAASGNGTTPTAPTADAPWSVARMSRGIKSWLDKLGTIWVEGEITQWNLRAGIVYGKLKDLNEDVTVSFSVFSSVLSRTAEQFSPGDRVVMLAKVDWWVKAGSASLQVAQIKHVGLGALLEGVERLRKALAAEGLFDGSRKQPLPFLPGCIGLVTGKDSDAEKDVIQNATRRWPDVRFRVVHAMVQGDRAVPTVVAAIGALDADPEVDVIIVARGGGDLQALLPFSDERVVRAAAACRTPLVSAIGHEADRPLLDEVADLRASTPTDAAKRVVPDVAAERDHLDQWRLRLRGRVRLLIDHETHRLAALTSRPALATPGWIIDQRAADLAQLVGRGTDTVDRYLEQQQRRVGELQRHVRALSPQSTLDRGYAIVQGADEHVVRGAAEASAAAGAALHITLAAGSIGATSTGPV